MNSPESGTTLRRERRQQEKWQLLPRYAGIRIFDDLLNNEFLHETALLGRQQQIIEFLLRFSTAQVPYYRRLFNRLKLEKNPGPDRISLQEIPILTKREVQEYHRDLLAESLPRGESVGRLAKTSGTTGHPLTVRHSARSGSFSMFLKQRELRWFRFEPRLILAAIRSSRDLPPKPDGSSIEIGETISSPHWPSLGPFFATGPFYGFMWTNPIEAQKEWLARVSPAYLLGQSADLEHLALAYGGEKTPQSLKGILAISQELPEDMEERLIDTFRVPVAINYGLNEVGIVASRCPEGRRYHVHVEHCHVEIVDDDGKLCKPGQKGRIVVTPLNNLVMPLIRYDTDDLAEAAEGPCPCGRTLPSFGRIHGRYRRLAALPPGTMNFLSAVIGGIDDMPKTVTQSLRQYQLHQSKDGSFTLRIVASSPLPSLFHEKIMAQWDKVESAECHRLVIKEVDAIPRPQGGKFQKFTSDFMPIPQPDEKNDGSSR